MTMKGTMSRCRTLARAALLGQGVGLLALLIFASSVQATIYTVGAGADCTHSSLQAAVAAAVADTSPGWHEIRLPTGVIVAHDIEIINPAENIRIIGGFSNCSQSQPTPGQSTTVDAGGIIGRPIFRISQSGDQTFVALVRLSLIGGRDPAVINAGGAVWADGAIVLFLADSQLVGNEAQTGGAVAIGNPLLTTRETQLAALRTEFLSNPATGGGFPGSGGAILAWGRSRAEIQWDVRFEGNTARNRGGAIALEGELTHLWLRHSEDDVVRFWANSAGNGSSFESGTGFGGAIYSRRGRIETSGFEARYRGTDFRFNSANFGGAVYVEGADAVGSPFTLVNFNNPSFVSNSARGQGGAVFLRNAVDLIARKDGPGTCAYNPGGLCVIFQDNESQNIGGDATFGSGGVAFLSHAVGAPRPAIRIAGALFQANRDPNGTAAVIDARGNSAIRLLRNVFINNASGTVSGTPFRSLVEAQGDTLFGYNTVLANDVARVFYQSAGTSIDLHGSIVHVPGTQILWGGGTASTGNGCVISHHGSGLGDGASVADPMIDAAFRPMPSSLAVDFCDFGVGDLFWPADRDALRLPVPMAIRPPLWGPFDLGAIELRDEVFQDRFQAPGP